MQANQNNDYEVITLTAFDQINPRGWHQFCLCYPFPDKSEMNGAIFLLNHYLQNIANRFPYLCGMIAFTDTSKLKIELRYPKPPLDALRLQQFFTVNDLTAELSYEELTKDMMPRDRLEDRFWLNWTSPNPEEYDAYVMNIQANLLQGGLVLSFSFYRGAMDIDGINAVMHQLFREIRMGVDIDQPCSTGSARQQQFRNRMDIEFGTEQQQEYAQKVLAMGERPIPSPNQVASSPYPEINLQPPLPFFELGMHAIFTFSSGFVHRLYDAVGNCLRKQGKTITIDRKTCLAAFIWSDIMRVRAACRGSSFTSTAKIGFGTNARKVSGVHDLYIGNMMVPVLATSSLSHLIDNRESRNGEDDCPHYKIITRASLKIREAETAVNADYVKERYRQYATLPDPTIAINALSKAIDLSGAGVFFNSLLPLNNISMFPLPSYGKNAEFVRTVVENHAFAGMCTFLPRSAQFGNSDFNEHWEVSVGLAPAEMQRIMSDEKRGLKRWAKKVDVVVEGF
ncbi:uncharacterized protein K452DRAFT_362549 [Aplosporella prunicola CBS 121167]|uniref:Trichothecene 3-O-acetyltransferase-like N-terminal domain-containing protein n=1 Tax=Aplosporella prunicola CBS 121167 TaxID=1176127 RepID=A0A6A6AWR7_9PEZI|nr:uncharacterized protein K452DRAFT_362549 [Aplosporella prunicola CBS 121167]KAF2136389.1 hypothetical protein K452DRAFT_362549 [Aplosporella prunicola CBS 121167]